MQTSHSEATAPGHHRNSLSRLCKTDSVFATVSVHVGGAAKTSM